MSKVAVVTGAARGIGRAIAQRLVSDGFRVVMAGLGDDVLAVAEAMGGDGVKADVSRAEDVAALYRHVHRAHGRLDVLVNNAGILGDARLGMIAADMIDHVLATTDVTTAMMPYA